MLHLSFPPVCLPPLPVHRGQEKPRWRILIIGLLQPQKGRILIDDHAFATIDIRSWRRMIGYVPQETLLLHDTVMKNVTLGAPELSEKDVKNALRAAGIWDFVMNMPAGDAQHGGRTRREAFRRSAAAHRHRKSAGS